MSKRKQTPLHEILLSIGEGFLEIVRDVIKCHSDPSALQNALLDVLGAEHIDLIERIVLTGKDELTLPSQQGSGFRPDVYQAAGQKSVSSSSSSSLVAPSKATYSATSAVVEISTSEKPLSADQQRIVDCALNGDSIFFTGPAGVGKSHTLHAMVTQLENRGKRVQVTASTGVAAINVKGTTLHSFAGIGIGQAKVEQLIANVKKSKWKVKKWTQTDVLVIDEISMIDGDLFDKIEAVARAVRRNSRPFGGVQMILTGDFAQLPPVSKNTAQRKPFAFESEAWKKTVQRCFELTHVFRQKNEVFIKQLHQIRRGIITQEIMDTLTARIGAQLPDDGILPTKLFALRKDVSAENVMRLNQIQKQMHIFQSTDGGDKYVVDNLLDKSCLAKKQLKLKEGAQVVLLKNLNVTAGLCNGTRGVVVGFGKHDYDQGGLKKKSGKENYVSEADRSENCPRVKFDNGVVQTIGREVFSVEDRGVTVAYRRQIPLMLAYALTIHKAQGMSLSRAEIDLSSVFEEGQGYVALSRITDLSGLRITRQFNADRLMANETVLQFYANLKQGEQESASRTGMETWVQDRKRRRN